jgi:ribosome maturation factor RimP
MSGGVAPALRERLDAGVRALGFEMVDVELGGARQHQTLRVYIDGPRGVTVEDCADVSRQLSAILDVEDPIPGSYTLEVSSPGLDRPLVTPADYRRFEGAEVRIRLLRAQAGRRNFRGRIVGTTTDAVLIEVDGEPRRLAFADIERARLVPQL